MDKKSKIYIAGHSGMVGSAILRILKEQGYQKLILKTSKELDLRRTDKVESFMQEENPEYVFLCAAKVGGIKANLTFPAEFIYDNMMIEANVINASYRCNVKKLLYLGSSCIYPRDCPQPINEEYLLTGRLEATNEPYAIAKIAGIKLCQSYNRQYGSNFISLMPTNLYGINDNFDTENAHVIPALIRKFHEAKIRGLSSAVVWGTGSARREFLYVDDLADACLYLMDNYMSSEIINVGWGEDISVKDLALLVKEVTGYGGDLVFDTSMPDGTPRKLLDISRLDNLGWHAKVKLEDGLKATYRWYRENYKE
jgi:GDP-L-fucose synthase